MSPVPSQPSVDLPDRGAVRASWQRSAEHYRVAQDSRQAPWILTAQELSASRAPVDELIGIAAHENDRLFAAVGNVGYALLFTAADGVVVDVRGDPARIQQFKHWGIWQGGIWAESVEGTNGIGTCIAERRPSPFIAATTSARGTRRSAAAAHRCSTQTRSWSQLSTSAPTNR